MEMEGGGPMPQTENAKGCLNTSFPTNNEHPHEPTTPVYVKEGAKENSNTKEQMDRSL